MMYEGVPNYPDFGRFWQIVAKHRVNIFYTAPPPYAHYEGRDLGQAHTTSPACDCWVP
ncbi:MAG: hypothetical protein Ct9H300mP7_3630 [Verrucomicrobiota bacterium]|nr:MAG: hypothetical protein Ct9H300mP7_3630 [Verrucomicrobiota bacterium]